MFGEWPLMKLLIVLSCPKKRFHTELTRSICVRKDWASLNMIEGEFVIFQMVESKVGEHKWKVYTYFILDWYRCQLMWDSCVHPVSSNCHKTMATNVFINHDATISSDFDWFAHTMALSNTFRQSQMHMIYVCIIHWLFNVKSNQGFE